VQKAVAEATWDEGKIQEFQANPRIQGQAWDIGEHTLYFFATAAEQAEQGRRIAKECWKLWTWLGVSRPFKAVLWYRQDPRHIAADEWPSKSTVNGGWTWQNSDTVFIYRREEWDRVFLHEMIHALGWDWKMPETPLACWGLPTDSALTPALFEAWTELYAEWLWCCWHFDNFETAWMRTQRSWQRNQAVQILARHRMLGMRAWTENTSVFAYYVLKAALAPHIAQLLLFGNGGNAKERAELLCELVTPELSALRHMATHTQPQSLSLRMTAADLRVAVDPQS
jgi:hypothetical protein